MLNKAIQSLIASQDPAATPEDTLEKISILIDAGRRCEFGNLRINASGNIDRHSLYGTKNGKSYMETISLNIDYSTDMCHVNGVAKICKDTSPGEREQMKAEIRQIFKKK